MREKIANWYRINNGHPYDDQSFYDIVIESKDNKVELATFKDALHDANKNITNEKIEDVYRKYELLHNFLSYYKSKK